MKKHASGKGFERLGGVDPRELGLPRKRAEALLLSRTWGLVVGDVLARKTRAVRIQRGVMEVEVEDARWADALVPRLPDLARRAAAAAPALAIRSLRLRVSGSGSVAEARPGPAEAAPGPIAAPGPAAGVAHPRSSGGARVVESESGGGDIDLSRRLAAVRERYVARARSRGGDA